MNLETKQIFMARELVECIDNEITIGDSKELTIKGLERIKEKINEEIQELKEDY